MRADFGDSNLPFIVGKVGTWNGRGTNINPLLNAVTTKLPFTDWVSSKGYTSIDLAGNDPHFDNLSQRSLGGRYADKVAELVYKTKAKGATLFNESTYGGRSILLIPGTYSNVDLEGMGIFNNELASIKLDIGYKVTLKKNSSNQLLTPNVSVYSGFAPEVVVVSLNSTAVAQKGYMVSTITGKVPNGFKDGAFSEALFKNNNRMVFDLDGNLLVADRNNHRIRKINLTTMVVSTVAGSGVDGTADNINPLLAQFSSPSDIAIDAMGNVYIADKGNNRIRKLDKTGYAVNTVAGSIAGNTEGSITMAKFYNPIDVAVTTDGTVIYVADELNHKIRKIAGGNVSTLAGTGVAGTAIGQLNKPSGITIDATGNILVANRLNHCIHKITPNGVSTTLAGIPGAIGNVDGSYDTATFDNPFGIGVNRITGEIYVTTLGKYIRSIADGNVTTIAGDGVEDNDDGDGSVASFYAPQGVVVGPDNNLYISDTNNSNIRKITIVTPLPVNLVSFNVKAINEGIRLNWITSSEQVNSHFEVLRSETGNDFSVIATIAGNGNANTEKHYSYIDNSPFSGTIYYQLRQVDYDGKTELFGVRAVRTGLRNAKMTVYASSRDAFVKVFAYSDTEVSVTDIQGKVVYSGRFKIGQGNSELFLPLALKTGLYVATLQTLTENTVTKFIVE